MMAGCICTVISDGRDGNRIVREEADNFAFWLADRMSRAQVEECSFKISMSQQSTKNAFFRLIWQDGTQDGKTETYQTSRARIFPVTGDLSKPRVFDGEWGSFTPALTVDIKPQPPHNGDPLYVVVSGAGYITVRDKIN